MGGSGSGRWSRHFTRATTNRLPVVDIARVRREFDLRPGASLVVGEYRAELRLDWTACRFGGQRPWLSCPGCRRRCAKLYLTKEHPRCRLCLRLGFPSQNESDVDRAMTRAQRLFQRLGGTGNISNGVPIPPRPKGMRRRTYERLRREAREARADFWGGLAAIIQAEDRRLADLAHRTVNGGKP